MDKFVSWNASGSTYTKVSAEPQQELPLSLGENIAIEPSVPPAPAAKPQ
jgi:hypothetical protein